MRVLPPWQVGPQAAAAVVLVLSLSLAVFASPRAEASTAGGSYFDHIVIVVMENHNLCDILTSCGGSATYLTSLANAFGLAREDRYCHVNPSLPNYLCLTGGTDFGCPGYDGGPNTNTCTRMAWTATNIVDRLENASLTWKAYMEDMPSSCSSADSADGKYVVRHNPFVYYANIATNPTRCARVVPAGIAGQALLDDLASTTTASNYLWLTPNICNDMHSCPIATGDAYLASLVPKILNSPVFRTQRAALFVTFDEGYGQPIYTVWAGPVAKAAYASSIAYDHYSLLATIEANWNLAPLTANDRNAATMAEFFAGRPPQEPPIMPFIVNLAIEVLIGVAVVAGIAFFLTLRRRRRSRESPREGPEESSVDPNTRLKR
ncbi:MAG TPA: alkaline phosphatase family protein [Thermoplasmata archaeon]|nr:alkaline phosphatase family protein [Thermoplasmata archaeon]